MYTSFYGIIFVPITSCELDDFRVLEGYNSAEGWKRAIIVGKRTRLVGGDG